MSSIKVKVTYTVDGHIRHDDYWTSIEKALDLEEFEPSFAVMTRNRDGLSRHTPVEVLQVEVA